MADQVQTDAGELDVEYAGSEADRESLLDFLARWVRVKYHPYAPELEVSKRVSPHHPHPGPLPAREWGRGTAAISSE